MPLQTQGLPRMPCLLAVRITANRSCFSGIFMFTLNKGICHLIRICRLLIEQTRLLCLVIRFVRDRYARAKTAGGCLAQKKFQKKIPKKKRLTNTI